MPEAAHRRLRLRPLPAGVPAVARAAWSSSRARTTSRRSTRRTSTTRSRCRGRRSTGTPSPPPTGCVIEFLEPGRVARVTYASADGARPSTSSPTGVTPLLARGHVVPGEEDHHSDPGAVPGGSEQFMHMTGELVLQRRAPRSGLLLPARPLLAPGPHGDRGTAAGPAGGLVADVLRRRSDLQSDLLRGAGHRPRLARHLRHPGRPAHAPLRLAAAGRQDPGHRPGPPQRAGVPAATFTALRQEIEAEDETGGGPPLHGEAIATATMPAWPNVSFHDSVYRWTDETGSGHPRHVPGALVRPLPAGREGPRHRTLRSTPWHWSNTRDPEKSAVALRDWLAGKLSGAHDVEVTDVVTPQASGMSNETLMFTRDLDLRRAAAARRVRRPRRPAGARACSRATTWSPSSACCTRSRSTPTRRFRPPRGWRPTRPCSARTSW